MAKVQKLEESLCATEKVISSLEKARDDSKVGRSFISLFFSVGFCFVFNKCAFTIPVSCSQDD